MPLVFKAGGRSSDDVAALVRSCGHGLSDVEREIFVNGLRRRLDRVLQLGTAETVLNAVHG